MNLGGHIAVVANAAHPRWSRAAVLLGAALPDIGAMGRFRLLGSAEVDGVSEGIWLHHRTDELFHRHRWFRHRLRSLTVALGDAGLGRGPSMACSHVGIELLLDGRLAAVDRYATATASALATIGPNLEALAPLVGGERRDEWLDHLRRFDDAPPPEHDDPAAVAARLHRICRRRERLAFDERFVDVVAEQLAVHKPAIDATAFELVDDLAGALITIGSAARDADGEATVDDERPTR